MTIDPATGAEIIEPTAPGADPVDPAIDPPVDDPQDPDAVAPQGETPQQKEARLARTLDRHRKKFGLGQDDPAPKPADKTGELDYGQKAFLISSGIKTAEEQAVVKEVMKTTGKSLEDVLAMKYVQAELKDVRDAAAAADALPRGTKRPGQTTRDTVEYWIAKGELPPADQVQLRRDVVNAKMKQGAAGNPFTSNPVVR